MGVVREGLVDGVWQDLFKAALTLIDEITKHGGVADPFFTFGGGTVLMLRYQHRFSKDIDIFVPDPQSLGYINPRLCDVADELCESQYVEAANFIKLILPIGEIDFVASPNLLDADKAYEDWHLFGRRVRVETAAEIIAKKMYHRGAQATARDLFDLAMVIEHEPAALIAAKPSMERHRAAFCANLNSASRNFQLEFESVKTITYRPTFDHARDVALRFLANLG